jgi:hypothetical protein
MHGSLCVSCQPLDDALGGVAWEAAPPLTIVFRREQNFPRPPRAVASQGQPAD